MVTEFHTKYLPPDSMVDQYGVMPEDYVLDLKRLSNERYSQGMLLLHRPRSNS